MELEELSVDQMTSAPGHREEKIRGSRTRRWRKRKERKEMERKRKKKKIEKKKKEEQDLQNLRCRRVSGFFSQPFVGGEPWMKVGRGEVEK